MPATILQVTDLSKNYKNIQAVDKVSLLVRQGEIFGFLGPNSAGKTTTIGMILGLIHPSYGKVEVFGKEVKPNQTQPLKRVGSLDGAPGLIPYLTSRENLNLLACLSPEVNNQQIQGDLKQVGLDKVADRMITWQFLMSLGQVGLWVAKWFLINLSMSMLRPSQGIANVIPQGMAGTDLWTNLQLPYWRYFSNH